jgi:hypothetical protein
MGETNTTDRRQFLKDGVAAVIGLGALPFVLRSHRPTSSHHSILGQPDMRAVPFRSTFDEPNIHNMLMVGQETVFLSHLPMFKTPDFDSPHRYQVILEATLKKDGRDVQPTYASDRKSNPSKKIYTLGPEEFILPNLSSANSNPPLSKFKAGVFRGHLEKPGKKLIIEDADVSIQNVVHFREFDPQAQKLAQLRLHPLWQRERIVSGPFHYETAGLRPGSIRQDYGSHLHRCRSPEGVAGCFCTAEYDIEEVLGKAGSGRRGQVWRGRLSTAENKS